MPGRTEVVTFAPDGTSPRWLGQYGSVSGVKYSFTTPGGCDQFACSFAKPARYRTDAMNPGRILRGYRGSTIAWEGILDEPQPSSDGWSLAAHGAGTFGDDYLAIWTGSWGTGVFNNAIDAALGRGLDWVRVQNIGAVANIWTGQQVDSGDQTISDLLSLGCHKGGLTWTVATVPQGHVVSVYALPTVANRILVSSAPEARSISDGPSTLYVRYQTSWDTTKVPAQYALTSVTSAAEEARHGRREDLMDISSAGVYSAGSAQGFATNALKRFQRAAFTDAFTVQPGELLNEGGTSCDLGLYWQDGITAMVCDLWLADFGYGGEVVPGPVSFLVGHYEFDQDAGTAQITPYESARHDLSSVLSQATENVPVRTQPVKKVRKKKKK